MSESNEIVLDANILLRGVLGEAVSSLLDRFSESTVFCISDVALADARRHIPALASKLHLDDAKLLFKLDRLQECIYIVHRDDYEVCEAAGISRLRSSDASDWPIVATCLLLGAPLWTEDRDFFGCGVATWTTSTVGLFLQAPATDSAVEGA